MAELQDRVLQQEVSSQDQFLQLHSILNEGQGLNTPHKDVVKVNRKKGKVAGVERTTSARKNQETIRVNEKVLPSKIIKPAVFPSLIYIPLS
jgi:hypothetical protein